MRYSAGAVALAAIACMCDLYVVLSYVKFRTSALLEVLMSGASALLKWIVFGLLLICQTGGILRVIFENHCFDEDGQHYLSSTQSVAYSCAAMAALSASLSLLAAPSAYLRTRLLYVPLMRDLHAYSGRVLLYESCCFHLPSTVSTQRVRRPEHV